MSAPCRYHMCLRERLKRAARVTNYVCALRTSHHISILRNIYANLTPILHRSYSCGCVDVRLVFVCYNSQGKHKNNVLDTLAV